jgi:hypothetical protein
MNMKGVLNGVLSKAVSVAYLVGLLAGTCTFFAGHELHGSFITGLGAVALFALSGA